MKKLTENQKNFILKYFFENEKYAGWRNIASELLENGSCIVAETGCIWHGGVGNFIKTKPAEGAIDCTLYTFDLDEFLSSKWYKKISIIYISELAQKKREAELEYDEISSL